MADDNDRPIDGKLDFSAIETAGFLHRIGDFHGYYTHLASLGFEYAEIGQKYHSTDFDFLRIISNNWSNFYSNGEFNSVKDEISRDLVAEHYKSLYESKQIPNTSDIFKMHSDVFKNHGVEGAWIGNTSVLFAKSVDLFMGKEPSDNPIEATESNSPSSNNTQSTPNPHERNGVELGDNGQLGGGSYYGLGGATPDGPDGGGQTTTSTTTTTANYGPPGTATSGVNTNRDGDGGYDGTPGFGSTPNTGHTPSSPASNTGDRWGGSPHGPHPESSSQNSGRGGGNSGGGKPLILDMNRDGLRLSQQHHSMTDFDFDDDGYFERTAWTTGDDDAFLVFDIDNDNAITKAKEIAFAQWTDDPNDTDLEGLAAQFDSNKDGVLDAQDDNWLGFKIWQDSNQNGVVDKQEMKTLEQANINSFTLQRRANTGKAYGDRTIV